MKEQRYSVYYLEDDREILNGIIKELPSYGPWTVKGDVDENKALTALACEQFDLYLIDEWLSQYYPTNIMAGSQVFDKLKKMPTYRTASPVVIISQVITAKDLRKFGEGSDVWMPSHDFYEMRRVQGDLRLLSDSLLEIIKYHGSSSTAPPKKGP